MVAGLLSVPTHPAQKPAAEAHTRDTVPAHSPDRLTEGSRVTVRLLRPRGVTLDRVQQHGVKQLPLCQLQQVWAKFVLLNKSTIIKFSIDMLTKTILLHLHRKFVEII